MDQPIIYKVDRSEPVVIGYKGQSGLDTGYFFAPYRPGMSDEEIAQVNADIAERSKPPTELQQLIMKKVRNEQS